MRLGRGWGHEAPGAKLRPPKGRRRTAAPRSSSGAQDKGSRCLGWQEHTVRTPLLHAEALAFTFEFNHQSLTMAPFLVWLQTINILDFCVLMTQ